jgi:putative thioredoxin
MSVVSSNVVPNVVEVTDADFELVVVEGSKTRPVVVDLWAAWCGPCRTLGPTLEKVAAEREGAFLLAKLDVDANQVGNALLQAVRSQGIPTVVAFRDGEPVSMFIGAYPEQEVNTFIDQLLPTEAEQVTEVALAEEAAGDLEGAEDGYREALEKDPASKEAAVGLARVLAERGDLSGARELIASHLPDADAERVASLIRLRGWATVEGNSDLDVAKRKAASGVTREALEGMLSALTEDRDAARQAMVDVFAVIGDEDPLTTEFRRKLTNALY